MCTELNELLKINFFSTVIDETTDVSVEKKLAVMIQYYDFKIGRLVVDLLDMVECLDGRAVTLTEKVLDLMKSRKIDLKMMVGFCADTCNAMFGVNNSVAVHLKKEIPNVLAVKCSCHSIHLSASKATKKLPKQLEDLIYGVYAHFSRSSIRRHDLKEFQEFAQCNEHIILKPSGTRWLALHNCIIRLIQQLPALELYFSSEILQNPSATMHQLLETIRDPLTLPYLEFLEYSLGCLTNFNTVFQTKAPLLHKLKSEFNLLAKSLAKNFMNISYVRSKKSAFEIDCNLASQYVPLDKIYIGKKFYVDCWLLSS